MTIIEQMARAHRDYLYTGPDDFYPRWDDIGKDLQIERVEQMRAALVALRDCGVTDAMFEAWGKADGPTVRSICVAEFRAMLAAILEEK